LNQVTDEPPLLAGVEQRAPADDDTSILDTSTDDMS
jgi:hypothetical protein